MKTVTQLIDDIIKTEGGFINHPNDRGGPTKYGITLVTLSRYLNKHCTVDDVKALTKELAAKIYQREYYELFLIDKLPAELQPMVFDMAVNHGGYRAIKLLQEELDYQCYPVGKIDGLIGAKTINAAMKAIQSHSKRVINGLSDRRVAFYKQIVKNDQSQSVFLDGWLARADSFRV